MYNIQKRKRGNGSMSDNITPEHYRAEIAMLNHEIYRLTKKLENKEQERLRSAAIDKYDPFDNPTDYKGFGGDYTKIEPNITVPDYVLPLEPDYTERRNLRRHYSIGGWCMLFQFAASFLLITALSGVIMGILAMMNTGVSTSAIQRYMNGSSISAGMNMLVYLICNVTFAFVGLKWSGIKASQLIRTRDFGIASAAQYCFAALFIWTISAFLGNSINEILKEFGYSSLPVDTSSFAKTGIGFAVLTIYSCIIAPVTEELFFRGMLLRVFSKANQRFAVIATAFFFGLSHGNIPQFLLAFSVGILLGHITLKHGSIIPAIIVHIFINTYSALVDELCKTEDLMLLFMMEMMLISCAVFGLIMLITFIINNRLPSTMPKQARRGLNVAVGSIPFLASVMVQFVYMLSQIFSKS